MSYLETLLADGEDVVLRTRQHWLALVTRPRRGWLLLLLALVAGLLGLVVGGDSAGNLRAQASQALGLVAFVLLLLAALTFVLHAWRWMAEAYLITTRRVIQVEGIVNKRAADSSLEKINDAVLYQGLGGRIFGYGDLDVLTASESAIDRFRLLRDAPGFKRTMLNQKHELERDLAFRPSPPVRLGGQPGSHVPGQSAQTGVPARPGPPGVATPSDRPASGRPTSSAATGDSGRQHAGEQVRVPRPEVDAAGSARGEMPDALIVTQTLARLAELRDRGAISEDEYQAKKVELLQRL